jgi:hypothetical protein
LQRGQNWPRQPQKKAATTDAGRQRVRTFTSKNEFIGDFAGFHLTPLRAPAPEALSIEGDDLIKEVFVICSTAQSTSQLLR